jgi:hypothetical protein
MEGMDLSGLPDLFAGVWTLAKEMGKGGGGSTEEPTVCFALLPIGVGVLAVAAQSLRRRLSRSDLPRSA